MNVEDIISEAINDFKEVNMELLDLGPLFAANDISQRTLCSSIDLSNKTNITNTNIQIHIYEDSFSIHLFPLCDTTNCSRLLEKVNLANAAHMERPEKFFTQNDNEYLSVCIPGSLYGESQIFKAFAGFLKFFLMDQNICRLFLE